MPLDFFLQVKKINKDKNIMSFFKQTQTLLSIKFVFFNIFCLKFEKLTTRACCINYLVFLTIKSYQNS